MIEFSTARNGSKTCSVNGKYLHSLYNPEKEAERFVSNLQCDYNPQYIVITEPVLSYSAPYLKKRFPSSKLCAIRYCDAFSETDSKWDFVFKCEKNYFFSCSLNVFRCFIFNSFFIKRKTN